MTDSLPHRLLATRTDQPRVEHHTYLLLDPHGEESPLSTADVDEDRVVDAGTRGGGAAFWTGGNDFHPTVRLESWSGPAPAPEGEWDTVDEVDVEMPSGTALVTPMDRPATCEELELGHPGWYRLRAASRGRMEAADRAEEDDFFHGVEEWVLQLWPREGQN